MKNRGRSRKGWFRFPECMVFLGALGVVASLAVPSYLSHEKRERVKELMTSTASFREDVSEWVERSNSTTHSLENGRDKIHESLPREP